MSNPLKLYVNRALMSPQLSYVSLLFPFWGPYKKEKEHYAGVLEKHMFDKSCFELVSNIDECEYVLLPHAYSRVSKLRPQVLKAIADEAQQYHKPLLIDDSGDLASRVSYHNCRILRIDAYRFLPDPRNVIVPVPCEDLLESFYDNKLSVRKKRDVPSIGFVGWGSLPLKQTIRTLTKELPQRFHSLFNSKYSTLSKGVFWRARALKAFMRSSVSIENAFIIRSSYSGSQTTAVGDPQKNRREFVQNIYDNDYALTVRGDPNISTRIYEVLSLGRIPVLIDTEVVLPLQHLVNYREFCVFIDYADIKHAPEILADFHAQLPPEKFEWMQKRAREVFEKYLRTDSFSPYLVELLR